ncbi:MAG: hypothetical protein JL50_09810 [Peptococcaceae bacterium BICA1-7]|nr:MAG: hypothetical protein JL50_09810 [Peptococcaceae bacterium BICA1-7]HBV95577.1 MerR family transcriptional regulator [Desulfotomaculum sp.]
MYTIGQFSKICRVTTKALRHYEKIGLISPARVDHSNNYRYFTREQIHLIERICLMKDLGIPLKVVKRIIEKSSRGEVDKFLEDHRQYLIKQLDLFNSRLVRLTRWQKAPEVKEMSQLRYYDVRIREIQEVLVRSVRKKIEATPQNIVPLMGSVLEEIISLGGVCAGPPVLLSYDEEFSPKEADLEVCWPVADQALATGQLPPVQAATCMHTGPYDGLEKAYGAIFEWINKNGYRAVFPVREISHNDPRTTPAEQLVTEIIVPVVRD